MAGLGLDERPAELAPDVITLAASSDTQWSHDSGEPHCRPDPADRVEQTRAGPNREQAEHARTSVAVSGRMALGCAAYPVRKPHQSHATSIAATAAFCIDD